MILFLFFRLTIYTSESSMLYFLLVALVQATGVTAYGEAAAIFSADSRKSEKRQQGGVSFEPHTLFKVQKDSAVTESTSHATLTTVSEEEFLASLKTGGRKQKRHRNKKRSNRPRRHRRHNHSHNSGFKRRSCPSKTSYEFKTEAEDIFGHSVQIHPQVHIGNIKIDQYFYETYCAVEQCNCAGINNNQFTSSCETTFSYTYARVIKNGQEGWAYIKVRSGCSCVIQERSDSVHSNIFDL